MRPAALAVATLALLSAAGCGGPPLFAEIADERICVTMPAEEVPAAPAGIGERTVTWQGQLDVGEGVPGLDKRDATTGTIELNGLSMASTTDASGVAAAEVTITEADPSNPSVPRVLQRSTYTRKPGADPRKLVFEVESPARNLLPALTAQGGVLHYQVTFRGTPPTQAWTASVESCVRAHVTVDLTKL